MSKTPFEIRLELLTMAKEMLEAEHAMKCDNIRSVWELECGKAMEKNEDIPYPPNPVYPSYPSEMDVIQKANELNKFVSNG